MKSKDGFILIDALFSIFITSITVLIIFNAYTIFINYKNIEDKKLEEYEWKRIMVLSKINTCVIEKEDLYYLEH